MNSMENFLYNQNLNVGGNYESVVPQNVWVWDCIRLKAVEQHYVTGGSILQLGMDAKFVCWHH